MSGTTPAPPTSTSTVNDNTTQGTASAAYAVAAAIVTIVMWILSLYKIDVPPQVSAAMLVIVGAALHYAAVRFFSATAKAPTP